MKHGLFVRTLRNISRVALLAALSSMAMAADKHYTVSAPDGVKLAVQESGDPTGPTVIFIHGLLGSRLNWEKQIISPELQRYRMVTYDLRGHGLSGKPENIDAYRDGRRYADDLAAIITQYWSAGRWEAWLCPITLLPMVIRRLAGSCMSTV